MSGQTEKRSSMDGMDGVDHLGGSPGTGVGARHGHPAPQAGGGGYQGTRGVSKFANFAFGDRDPRIDELRTMGLQARWIRIAEAIGVDAFLAMWRILDSYPSVRTDKGDLAHTCASSGIDTSNPWWARGSVRGRSRRPSSASCVKSSAYVTYRAWRAAPNIRQL